MLFEINRTDQYPYIKDLGIESNVMQQNIGHTLELLFKAYIYYHFDIKKEYPHIRLLEQITMKRIRGKTSLKERINTFDLRTHDLRYLFILCKSCGLKEFFKVLNHDISNWEYYKLRYERFLELPTLPNIFDFNRCIYNLNTRYSSPFDTRYPALGLKHIPDVEVLIAGATTFHRELKCQLNS